jgi:hypothetical protein
MTNMNPHLPRAVAVSSTAYPGLHGATGLRLRATRVAPDEVVR